MASSAPAVVPPLEWPAKAAKGHKRAGQGAGQGAARGFGGAAGGAPKKRRKGKRRRKKSIQKKKASGSLQLLLVGLLGASALLGYLLWERGYFG